MSKIQIAVICLMILSGAGNILFLTGCKSFDPVVIQGQPDECNDFYSVLKYYSVEGKDSAFVGTVYNECKTARSAVRLSAREKQCKELIYGQAELNKSDYKKYSEYQECLK